MLPLVLVVVEARKYHFITVSININLLTNAVRTRQYLYLSWGANDSNNPSFDTKMKWLFNSVLK